MSQDNRTSTLFSYRHTLEHPHLKSSLLKLKCEIFVVLGIIMPPLTHYDHKDTIKYLPKHHKTKGLTPNQVNIFKALENAMSMRVEPLARLS